jgi:hypothetical protein
MVVSNPAGFTVFLYFQVLRPTSGYIQSLVSMGTGAILFCIKWSERDAEIITSN